MIIPVLGIIIPNTSTKNPNISNALFSKTQQEVLGLLYTQPQRDFHTNEIIRLTHSGTGSVQRELAKLSSTGILTVIQVGNQKRYQANPALPFFAELRSLILKTFGLANILREALEPLTKKIQIAFIFGSIAKQEGSASSDIDLLFIGNDLSYGELLQNFKIAEEQLGRKINPTYFTSLEWTGKLKDGNNFIEKVLSQPKIFLKGTEDELVTLK